MMPTTGTQPGGQQPQQQDSKVDLKNIKLEDMADIKPTISDLKDGVVAETVEIKTEPKQDPEIKTEPIQEIKTEPVEQVATNVSSGKDASSQDSVSVKQEPKTESGACDSNSEQPPSVKTESQNSQSSSPASTPQPKPRVKKGGYIWELNFVYATIYYLGLVYQFYLSNHTCKIDKSFVLLKATESHCIKISRAFLTSLKL